MRLKISVDHNLGFCPFWDLRGFLTALWHTPTKIFKNWRECAAFQSYQCESYKSSRTLEASKIVKGFFISFQSEIAISARAEKCQSVSAN